MTARADMLSGTRDVIYNPPYKWAGGTKGAYMMYLSTSSTSVRSCIGFGVSKTASGPYTYVKTVIYSGLRKLQPQIVKVPLIRNGTTVILI